ncbi:hypothetical protein GCM10010344_72850 [Streptomyces bluensis]|nr:hypothetical protein GCM10010344_72850 [Streptomyces bluensis]
MRIDIEMTYRRCLPRTSSASPCLAPVIRKTWPSLCFRITFHHPPASDAPPARTWARTGQGTATRTRSTLRRVCVAYETGARVVGAHGKGAETSTVLPAVRPFNGAIRLR